MGGPRCPDSSGSGTVDQPEQRDGEFQPQHFRRFEILKSSTLGLVYPQNLRLDVVDVDEPTSIYLTSSTPRFVTSLMKWWKVKVLPPPSCEIYSTNLDYAYHEQQYGNETTGASDRRISGHSQKPYPVAQIKYPGWEGMSCLKLTDAVQLHTGHALRSCTALAARR
ncbi:hypothetical protein A1O1_03386 [Capronia coronata CBS 617.96]|uniref:Uncharacterized protein n=1 Tax=Capronia coronata CBS 617.96 TaxID=1182541 RepID=W9YBQ1_9EURO|nr:uncharacterized protein A1O1_03386 [Capronia coronata CBS 617.96]EXJ90287.1 hypothetical protein A1O1_03386 [Capronia coronata CBS 617.96]